MNVLVFTLIVISLLELIGFAAAITFLVIEFKERKDFKEQAKALIQTHNQLMVRMTEVDKKATDASAGIAYIRSLPQFKGGR